MWMHRNPPPIFVHPSHKPPQGKTNVLKESQTIANSVFCFLFLKQSQTCFCFFGHAVLQAALCSYSVQLLGPNRPGVNFPRRDWPYDMMWVIQLYFVYLSFQLLEIKSCYRSWAEGVVWCRKNSTQMLDVKNLWQSAGHPHLLTCPLEKQKLAGWYPFWFWSLQTNHIQFYWGVATLLDRWKPFGPVFFFFLVVLKHTLINCSIYCNSSVNIGTLLTRLARYLASVMTS